MSDLSYVGRRVLAHLPVWAEDEAAHIEAEGGADVSVRSYPLADFTARLLEDASTPDMSEEQVQANLQELQGAGLCAESDGEWRMTEAGYLALVTPKQEQDTSTPGPALLDLNPASSVSIGRSE